MTDEMWAGLRAGIELAVRVARAEGGVVHTLETTTTRRTAPRGNSASTSS